MVPFNSIDIRKLLTIAAPDEMISKMERDPNLVSSLTFKVFMITLETHLRTIFLEFVLNEKENINSLEKFSSVETQNKLSELFAQTLFILRDKFTISRWALYLDPAVMQNHSKVYQFLFYYSGNYIGNLVVTGTQVADKFFIQTEFDTSTTMSDMNDRNLNTILNWKKPELPKETREVFDKWIKYLSSNKDGENNNEL